MLSERTPCAKAGMPILSSTNPAIGVMTTPISEKDPEGFAKVEGRFIERFLEGIPLVLGYTEVAYTRRKTETSIEPSRGLLPAFRITERLRRAVRREIAEPKVTVLPNFEVHVESLFFPARTEAQLRPLGELVQRGIVTVFKLTKPKVAAALAAQADQNAIETLKALSGRELPPNVEHELRDWAGHSEKFILYEGFGVFEGRREATGVGRFVVETISPSLCARAFGGGALPAPGSSRAGAAQNTSLGQRLGGPGTCAEPDGAQRRAAFRARQKAGQGQTQPPDDPLVRGWRSPRRLLPTPLGCQMRAGR